MNTRKMHRTPVSTTPFGNQIGMSNAIFEIRSVFDLGGSTVTFEEDCILYFNGGLLTNGTIVGNKTAIDAPITQIFAHNLHVEGTWLVDGVYPDWFGCNYDCHKVTERDPVTNLDSSYWTGTDDSDAFNRAVEMAENCDIRKVKLSSGKYYINSPILINKGNILIEGVSGQLREEIYPIPTGQQSNDVDQISQSVIFVENDKDGFVISSTVCNNIMMSHINLVGAQEWKQGNANLTSNAINFMSDFGGPTWPVIFKYCHFQYFHRAFYLNSSHRRYSIYKLEIDHCSFWHNDYCVYFKDLIKPGDILTDEQIQEIKNVIPVTYTAGSAISANDANQYNHDVYSDWGEPYATGYQQYGWQMLFTNNCCHQNVRILHVNVQKDSLVIENNNSEGTMTSFSDGTSNAGGYAYDIQTGQRCHIRFAGNHFEGMGCKLLKVLSCYSCDDTIELYGNNTDGTRGSQPQLAVAHLKQMHVLRCDMPAIFNDCVVNEMRQDYVLGIEQGTTLATPFIPYANSTFSFSSSRQILTNTKLTRIQASLVNNALGTTTYSEDDYITQSDAFAYNKRFTEETVVEPQNVMGHLFFTDTIWGRLPMLASPLNIGSAVSAIQIAQYNINDDFSKAKIFKLAYVMRSEQMTNLWFGQIGMELTHIKQDNTQEQTTIMIPVNVAKKCGSEMVFQTAGIMNGVTDAVSIAITIKMIFGNGKSGSIFNPDYPVLISIPYFTYRNKIDDEVDFNIQDDVIDYKYTDVLADFRLPYNFIQQIRNIHIDPGFANVGLNCEEGDVVMFRNSNNPSKRCTVMVSQSGTINPTNYSTLGGTYYCNEGDHYITSTQRLMPGVYLRIGNQKVRVVRLVASPDNREGDAKYHESPFTYAVNEELCSTVTEASATPLVYFEPKFSANPFHYPVAGPMSQRLLGLFENGTLIFSGSNYVKFYVKDGELISFFLGDEGLHP